MDVTRAGWGEEPVEERGRKKRTRARGEEEGGVQAVDACVREARKEVCVWNNIHLHTRTVVKSKMQCVNRVLSAHSKFIGSSFFVESNG